MFLSAEIISAQKNQEVEKLKKTQKADLRMISSTGTKTRSKFMKIEDPSQSVGESVVILYFA